MVLIVACLIIFSLIGLIFASPKLSPIPYFPSHSNDIPLILEMLQITNDQVILDLGAGDGNVIFKAAQISYKMNLNTEFIAVESNPILWLVICIKTFFYPNRKQIHVVLKDLFRTNYQELIKRIIVNKNYSPMFYYYLTPWLVEPAYKQITKSISRANLVSYFYPLQIKSTKKKHGKNDIYLYTIK